MSLSPQNSDRDPYQLERLADELAIREAASPLQQSHLPVNRNLPEHYPLSHDDKHLSAQVFNVEEFLLARSHISLPDLRLELRQYLADLKEELVRLINDDYEAFISLSTDLRDEGVRLDRLKYPLANLRVKVLESKSEFQDIQNAIHDKLSERAILREEKALLHLLLKISESLMRLETMLLIATPDEEVKGSMDVTASNFLNYTNQAEDNLDEKLRTNRAKHLGRVAAEYTQLLYHVRKARSEHCSFVEQIQWRIDRVRSTLSSDLDQLFTQTVLLLADSKGENRGSELEKSKWIADLTECLRTYDVLGLWRDAEDVIRQEVVRNFVKKTIYSSALMVPHSPIVPHTPFHNAGPGPLTSNNLVHQIPYTPFTAFVPKQFINAVPNSADDLPKAYLLDDTDDSLAKLYNQILRFVERDLSRIMDLAEKVMLKPSSSASRSVKELVEPSTSDSEMDDDKKGFQILTNVVWSEISRAIVDEIGSVVFAAGRPSDFRKHYETTQAFIRSLELLAPSLQTVEALRRDPTYTAFQGRWQLPVYFQLRWKEIVGSLEDVLSVECSEPNLKKSDSFATPQAAAVWIAVSACWSSEIYIPELCHRFWRLSLQILSRYKVWLDESLVIIDTSPKLSVSLSQEKSSVTPNIPRASTVPDLPLVESVAADEALLKQYSAIIIDIKVIESNMLTLWRQVITMMMPETSHTEDLQVESAIRETLDGLTSAIPTLSHKIIAILTRRCCDALLPVRSIPSQFRAMSNKRDPTEPSYFVSSVLRPIKNFFAIGVAEGPGYLLKEHFMKIYATEVFDNVTQRYISYLTAMKKTEESLKRLKKGKKSTFSLFGSTNSAEEGRDEERIRAQMCLDAEAFGKDAKSLHVNVDMNQYFRILKEMVFASDED